MYKFLLASVLAIICISCGGPELPETIALAYESLPKEIDFNQDIKPILSDKCYLCHGPDKAKISAGLQLHQSESAYAELPESPGKYALVPGNLKKSETYYRILSEDPSYVMPTPESHLSLTAREKALLIKWIEEGATYQEHWAFIPPKKSGPPKVANENLIANEIDNFIVARLEQKNLVPSKKADRETLLRRLSFDLTGLPPTVEEINAFIADTAINAYEKQVDRLLASPHYGEHMALDWMDLSRYADTHGYTVDQYRDVSAWRDWVIKSFNENKRYDEFIQWQLAGDMLPNPTKEQILATTFNRLHPQNMEGGIVEEEFRSEYVADRTNVMGEGLLGLTVACAKCHDHKYDPISQKNYYEMYSFFNNINESGQISWDFSMPVPTLLLPTKEQEEFLAYVDTLIAEKEAEKTQIVAKEIDSFEEWLRSENYNNENVNRLPTALSVKMNFDGGSLYNTAPNGNKAKMRTQFTENEKAKFSQGHTGQGLELDGDVWMDLETKGIFHRYQPFSIGLRIFVPKDLENGVILHKMIGTRLFSYRGYHLNIKDNKLELLMAHVYPDNAIVERTLEDVPKEQWVQLTMTYDGSSKALGFKIFVDGTEMKTKVVNDNLTKDIVYDHEKNPRRNKEPGIQVGARWRGKGIGGAIVDDLLVFDKELSHLEVLKIADTDRFKEIIGKTYSSLSAADKKLLKDYYQATKSSSYKAKLAELQETRKLYNDSIEAIPEIMVMKEMDAPRPTYILERGQYDAYGAQVFPNTPEKIFPFSDSLPNNRLGLSEWIIAEDNPLTARVAVNRYWKNIFGTGLVKTVEDFGNQGEMPSHPKLLDWLAIRFMESGWNVKALHKFMVMSNTYQQSSIATPEHMEIDVENRLLARGPVKRLTGEMLRDNALAASGLLNRKIGGPSVRPYQPEGLWKINNAEYTEDTGDKLYRRSLYTIWKRSVPHPTIATFDAPDRSFCTVRRQKTNTPLQALVLLNDPTYIEAARVLGKNMMEFASISEGISYTFKQLSGRSITKDELSLLLSLRNEEYENFEQNPEKAKGWLNTGEFEIDGGIDTNILAANAVVASTIMNLDATITKR
ncbi:DUF1553 domain-containing protein [Maribacter algicola]|uniref:DUF1553 domain-containing protein n=1 Tax=Maribacter algicola TaxID=2498892 RepID=A0A3R8RY36_9FLAO|nr:DUF1553 domain-containing protein [Maribacter algicola]RRQ47997.1 DUF1553 domain-containing protein [Maribacter algicola]